MAWLCIAHLVVTLALAPESAADPDLGTAIRRYRALEYRAAAPLLEAVLAKPDLAAADRRLALAYLGRTRAALRDEPAAIDAFARLLELDPDFELNATESPLFRAALSEARERRADPIRLPAPATDTASPGAARPEVRSGRPAEPARASAASTGPVTLTATTATTATTAPGAAEQTRQPESVDDSGPGWVLGAAAVGGVVAVAAAGALALLIWQPWSTTAPGNLGRWELP